MAYPLGLITPRQAGPIDKNDAAQLVTTINAESAVALREKGRRQSIYSFVSQYGSLTSTFPIEPE
ncbi:hypothetical protein GRO01_09380 [Gluconobacter roseus NBRC 3990]|uniref:Uncharacterized protein n=1 Tax=Gluconobacter roseus NBRC 3990 TaxID=1307950 RepID=A0A4Y3M231_9PROT|nr:hypothetical protein AA3990_2048 [Gluconobacter roseus NBRC 3990]GEB03362.1 hypothetical protein GRO01_09380 [Gluconobacter roseus NBRC 3990]GLP93820.1 hypothetical protein GCM10007871_17980 [Gluconobacter roseus NBRC 3990]